jgi:hypothetical protein
LSEDTCNNIDPAAANNGAAQAQNNTTKIIRFIKRLPRDHRINSAIGIALRRLLECHFEKRSPAVDMPDPKAKYFWHLDVGIFTELLRVFIIS